MGVEYVIHGKPVQGPPVGSIFRLHAAEYFSRSGL